jgi:SAM-dependent methyltransferase
VAASYGPDLPDERTLRLCGDVSGRRVIELGLGPAPASIAFAAAGAKAIAVDPAEEHVIAARRAADASGTRVEFHRSDLADLGFATSGSVDLVFSALGLGAVEDVGRVFRQVHRVLRPSAPFVFSLPHPLAGMLEGGGVVLRRPYWADPSRTISGLYSALVRAGLQVDVIAEPPAADGYVPLALVIRARKVGS